MASACFFKFTVNTFIKPQIIIFFYYKNNVLSMNNHKQLNISGSNGYFIRSYKYLGTIIYDELSWSLNTHNINSKCQHRLYFLRLLNSFGVDKTILKLFYSSIIQSVFSFNIIIWWSTMGTCNQSILNRIMKKASKVICDTLCSSDQIYINNVVKKV